MLARLAKIETLFLRKASSANVQLDALDGLRGIAVLFVVLSHLSNTGLQLLPPLDFRGSGKYGVYLFFVLSAFLLTLPYVGPPRLRVDDARGWLRYALRRVLRVFPLYYFVLFVDFAMTTWAPSPRIQAAFTHMPGETFIAHLLLQEGKGLYWTIPVELKYYVALPFVVAFHAAALHRGIAWSTVGTALAVAAALLAWPPAATAKNTLQLGPYLPVFLLGSYAAVVHARLREAEPLRPPLRTALEVLGILCLLGVAALVPALFTKLSGHAVPKTHFHRHFLLFGALWSTLIVCLLHGRGTLRWLLSTRGLRLVGVVSFSVYLWHVQVIKALLLAGAGASTPTAWLAVLLAVAFAMVSWALIERPFVQSAFVRARIAALARPRSSR